MCDSLWDLQGKTMTRIGSASWIRRKICWCCNVTYVYNAITSQGTLVLDITHLKVSKNSYREPHSKIYFTVECCYKSIWPKFQFLYIPKFQFLNPPPCVLIGVWEIAALDCMTFLHVLNGIAPVDWTFSVSETDTPTIILFYIYWLWL